MQCPECGYQKTDWARAWKANIAKGDSPAPKIYWCPKCEHCWKEEVDGKLTEYELPTILMATP